MLTLEAIRRAVEPLAKKYHVIKVDLFGSYANGNATEDSDADFLVTFAAPVPSIFKVMGFREELSRELTNPVDVVTWPVPRMELLQIDKVITVYERAG